MITAMQMMLNDLISKRETYENASMYHSVATLETSIELAEYLLEKEKEQIMKANLDGYKEGCTYHSFDHSPITSEQYYNQTYKNQTP
jgi:hypothetical protein